MLSSPASDQRMRASPSPYRIALLNPNTRTLTTELMLACARRVAPPGVLIEGRTAPRGCSMITHQADLDHAAEVVAEYGVEVAAQGFDAIIVAGFGDPGLQRLRQQITMPVTGLAEAGIGEAAQGGRRFSIVTVTPELEASLRAAALHYGGDGVLASVRFTRGGLSEVMQTPAALQSALHEACVVAMADDGAQAIVIGGGPLAQAAAAIAAQLKIPVIDPVAAAVRLACARGGMFIKMGVGVSANGWMEGLGHGH